MPRILYARQGETYPNTSIAVLDDGGVSVGGGSGPGGGVVDADGAREVVLDKGDVDAGRGRDGVGNAVARGHGDGDALGGAQDHGGHLHVPVDEALRLVQHVGRGALAAGLAGLEGRRRVELGEVGQVGGRSEV